MKKAYLKMYTKEAPGDIKDLVVELDGTQLAGITSIEFPIINVKEQDNVLEVTFKAYIQLGK